MYNSEIVKRSGNYTKSASGQKVNDIIVSHHGLPLHAPLPQLAAERKINHHELSAGAGYVQRAQHEDTHGTIPELHSRSVNQSLFQSFAHGLVAVNWEGFTFMYLDILMVI